MVKLQPAIPPAEWFDLDRCEKMANLPGEFDEWDEEIDGDPWQGKRCPKCDHGNVKELAGGYTDQLGWYDEFECQNCKHSWKRSTHEEDEY